MQEITPQQEMAFQERMQQQQIDSNPNSVYADAAREEKIANVISQLNPELLLVDIEHRIRGEKKDHYTESWIPINKDKLISEELVQNYIAFLNVYLTQNNSLSNFSPEEINNIMNVHIYIESERVEYLKKILDIVWSLDSDGQDSIIYQNIPAKGWIQVSMSSNEFIALTDRGLLNELIEL
jgi:hypothetical protein